MDTVEALRVRTAIPRVLLAATLRGPTLIILQEAILLALEVTHLALEVTPQVLPQDLAAILRHPALEAIPQGLEVTLNPMDLVVILPPPLEVQGVREIISRSLDRS